MKKTVIILSLFFAIIFGDTISEIRELYSEIQNGIDSSSYYISELSINKGDKNSIPAIGTYNRNFIFYWSFDEENNNQLLKINIRSQYSAPITTEELLFNTDGELVFYYISGGYDEIERRYYFDGGKLIRVIDGSVISNNPSDIEINRGSKIQILGSQYKETFKYTHQ